MRFPRFVPFLVCITLNTFSLFAQSPNGNINGLVSDPSSAAVVGAEVVAVNDVTGVQYTTKSNGEGIYVLPNLPPGPYRVQVSKIGFKTLIKPDIILNVQDSLSINFTLLVGAFHEIVTVEGGAPLVNTESAAVSTVVDRQFAENLPMNGRSFQTLIELTPGVVLTNSSNNDEGQFSVNGQRATSNYWTVDGVSGNIGVSPYPSGNGVAGALGSFSALGGTNSLVSVDAMQEFRIQTSTYAPEYGRTPGAQVSIVTRSGTNQFHGTLFDYFRNDALDANDWFADRDGLQKPEERQNDFGGTLSGPIIKGKTFFFFSYEGLRLRLPQIGETTVPDTNARQTANGATQPYLNAFPLPSPDLPDDLANGIGEFNASFSNTSTLDAYSIRLDHKLNDKIGLFGRYNTSPSEIIQRGSGGSNALSVLFPVKIEIQTLTVGQTWFPSNTLSNDLRFNYSKTNAHSSNELDSFGGAIPLALAPFPPPFGPSDASFSYQIFSLSGGLLSAGENQRNVLQQFNIVEGLSLQRGTHSLKFGADFRRVSTRYAPPSYLQGVDFLDVPSAAGGNLLLSEVSSFRTPEILSHNLSFFAQDTWRIIPRLTATYGLRWDVDFTPSSTPNLLAVNRFSLNDLSGLSLAPPGTPPFTTTYGNFSPRVGLAYEINSSAKWQTAVRGGFGVFFDLASSEIGNLVGEAGYPFSAFALSLAGTFPLPPDLAAPPAITQSSLGSNVLSAFYPHLQLPYTLQWNVALEQAFGVQQRLTASYIGAAGRRLIQSAFVVAPNSNFGFANLAGNSATSDYHALQVQFQRRLSGGLQALASYTWAHSIDTASAGSPFGNESNSGVPGLDPNANRGDSDFDVRHAFSVGLTYDIPTPRFNAIASGALGGWSLQSVIQVRSATPVTLYDGESAFSTLFGGFTRIRPDIVPGQSFYLEGKECLATFGELCPGNKGFNPGAFTPPPTDSNGNPIRQGDLGRNVLRGFGATQWDFAVHRDFPIHEQLRLQFRAEMFNVVNHPNFASPVADISNQAQFGRAIQMLGRGLSGNNPGGGALSSIYQIGGPRSIQLALKLTF
jgi:carboxypeptidase family protein/TonB-dependent receptor-like protein